MSDRPADDAVGTPARDATGTAAHRDGAEAQATPVESHADHRDHDMLAPGSPQDVEVWLKAVKAVLLGEGFRRELKQAPKPGMVWGVIRQEPDDMQIHVRAFKDGRLETEVELSNKYVQHLWSHRRNAAPEVKAILEKHGVPTHLVSEEFQPITGTGEGKTMPEGRTKTNHIALLVAAGVALLVARSLWKRHTMRSMVREEARKILRGRKR